MGISDLSERRPHYLSGGEQRRAALAAILARKPDVLILDEPTAGLDPKQIIETRELIKSLAGDHTIILSTHILPEVAQTCQSVVIINKGQVVAVDTPENLTQRLKGSETIRVELDSQETDPVPTLKAVPGVTDVAISRSNDGAKILDVQSDRGADVRRELANVIVSNGWGLLELTSLRMSLEDVFLHLTTEEQDEGPIILNEASQAEQLQLIL